MILELGAGAVVAFLGLRSWAQGKYAQQQTLEAKEERAVQTAAAVDRYEAGTVERAAAVATARAAGREVEAAVSSQNAANSYATQHVNIKRTYPWAGSPDGGAADKRCLVRWADGCWEILELPWGARWYEATGASGTGMVFEINAPDGDGSRILARGTRDQALADPSCWLKPPVISDARNLCTRTSPP